MLQAFSPPDFTRSTYWLSGLIKENHDYMYVSFKGSFAQLLEQNSTRSTNFDVYHAFVTDLLSFNFLSMIFGLLGKFGIDIGKNIFSKIFFRNEKNLETFSKNIFSEKKSNDFDFI